MDDHAIHWHPVDYCKNGCPQGVRHGRSLGTKEYKRRFSLQWRIIQRVEQTSEHKPEVKYEHSFMLCEWYWVLVQACSLNVCLFSGTLVIRLYEHSLSLYCEEVWVSAVQLNCGQPNALLIVATFVHSLVMLWCSWNVASFISTPSSSLRPGDYEVNVQRASVIEYSEMSGTWRQTVVRPTIQRCRMLSKQSLMSFRQQCDIISGTWRLSVARPTV
jgi:hypothetical protein